MISYDKEFFEALVDAGRSFRAVQGKDPEHYGSKLAQYLRSEKALGQGERELLAQLVTGEWRNARKHDNGHSRRIKEEVGRIRAKRIREKKSCTWKQAIDEFLVNNRNYDFDYVHKVCTR
jgi:hypothetical protein